MALHIYYDLKLITVAALVTHFSSHVAGMVGLAYKTKGLRFCNNSGFLELYNDPEVRKNNLLNK